jgi:hypothetical protein
MPGIDVIGKGAPIMRGGGVFAYRARITFASIARLDHHHDLLVQIRARAKQMFTRQNARAGALAFAWLRLNFQA